MRHLTAVAMLALTLFAGTASAQSVSSDPRQAPAGAYKLEPRHTQILFAIRHLGITDYYGRFDSASGTLNFNPMDPSQSQLSVAIDTSSVDTKSRELTAELQKPAVFNTSQFPQATFKSTSATRTGPNTGTVTGDLTIKGITKPVTFQVTYNGGTTDPLSSGNTQDIGFHATATIKRSDYSMMSMIWSPMVSDNVDLIIDAMFQQTKE